MIALTAANAEIAEEVELGRTLLIQGHLDTAQRVLVNVCRAKPELAEAFRVLAMVLSKRGDERRARPLLEYADELDAQRTREIPAPLDEPAQDAETRQVWVDAEAALQAGSPMLPSPSPVAVVQHPTPPASPIVGPPSLPRVPGAPSRPTPPLVGALTLPATSAPRTTPATESPSRRGRPVLLLVIALGLAGGGFVAYKHYGKSAASRSLPPSPRDELDRALAMGSLDLLMRARDVARVALGAGTTDADALARLGLVNAFLVDDYGLEARKDAEAALQGAESTFPSSNERKALIGTARAFLAHASGDREEGRKQVDEALAAVAPDASGLALVASARLRRQAGDVEGGDRDIDRAFTVAPESAPVIVDWAEARLDGGDPVAARRALTPLLARSQENSLALLALSHAERALGETGWAKTLDRACRNDSKVSQRVRALCSVETAKHSRLEGDRAGAARRAKAVALTSEDARVLAEAALLLAVLGEVDAAAEALDRAGRLAHPAGPALQWANQAIRLGRGEPPTSAPLLAHPAGPERNLVALRAAYASNGGAGVAEAFKQLPPGIQDIDGDIRAFSALGREGSLSKAEMAALDRRADRGSPVVSYVLGVFASHEKDYKLAARRLERALAWHGDACQAAGLYLEAAKNLRRGAWLNKPALRNVRARNAKCSIPEP